MRALEWLAEKLTDLFRPWHDDGLPAELAFGEIEAWGFVRGSMSRCARMAEGLNVPFGVFGVIGIGYARRAARALWPVERMLMEDVSCAFQPVWTRAGAGQRVPQIQIDRLVFVLGRYLAHVGTPWSEDQLQEAVKRFIQECPTETSGDGAEQDA
ncbi:MAG: hypothetical protein P4L84_06915 [Isosphaeraceae bacterium]|nr:hypothetical protein [Isosphaeraceae bacterium]